MKLKKTLRLIILLCSICYSAHSQSKNIPENTEQKKEFYQLKTYLLDTEEQLNTTNNYLKNAYLPALKKLGINNIGVFKPNEVVSDTLKKLVVLIPFSSMDQFVNLENELAKDKTYLAAGADYLNASYKQTPYTRIESVILQSFVNHPKLTKPLLDSPRADRIYELRSYESPTEAYYETKANMFNVGGEMKLFKQLQFNAVFYGKVISGNKMPNLMYMTAFTDQESRDAHWKAFAESQGWKELSAVEKYKNTVSHIDIVLMHPTEYSDY